MTWRRLQECKFEVSGVRLGFSYVAPAASGPSPTMGVWAAGITEKTASNTLTKSGPHNARIRPLNTGS